MTQQKNKSKSLKLNPLLKETIISKIKKKKNSTRMRKDHCQK